MHRVGRSNAMTLFGTNGIRGTVNDDLTSDIAIMIGKAVGITYGMNIAVATDARDSADMLKSALFAGLMAVGCNVVDLGVLPTPALQYYVRTHDRITGGVMITASHNPSEQNGFKFIGPNGVEVTQDDESALEGFCSSMIGDADWDEIGDLSYDSGAASEYVDSVVLQVDAAAIRDAGLTVCADLSNGATCFTTPFILKDLGIRALILNADPTGGMIGVSSDPTEDKLTLLKTMVRESGADLGVAHDSDGDRTIFITSSGEYVEGDMSLALMAKYILEDHRGKVITPISSSKIVEDVVESSGGMLKFTPVGSHMLVKKIDENKAVFGGEENGGMVFPEFQNCRDGAMTMVKMIECIVKRGPLSNQLSAFSRYSTVKAKVDCSDEMKSDLLDHFVETSEGIRSDLTDGIKLMFDDGWVLLRPSTTEECFRIYSESSDEATARSRADRYVEEAKAYLESRTQ